MGSRGIKELFGQRIVGRGGDGCGGALLTWRR
jgi:hypothetical protein